MGFEMTKKAKKKTGGFEATSKLTIDRAQERKENKKELSKVNARLGRYSDFSRRYNSFLKSSSDYLSRRDTDSPFSGRSKNKNSNRPSSDFLDRSDAFRRGTTASDWSDPTKAAKLGAQSENIKTEAEKLLRELEADREYMTEEGYNSYKEFLSSVSKGDTAQMSEAFKSEAKARSYFKTEDNHKKAASAARKNTNLGISSATTYRELIDKLNDPTISKEDKEYIRDLSSSREFVLKMTADDVSAKIKTDEDFLRFADYGELKQKQKEAPYAFYDKYGNPVTWSEYLEILQTEDLIKDVFEADWNSRSDEWKKANELAGVTLPEIPVTGYTKEDKLKLEKIYREHPELISDLVEGGVEKAYKKTDTYFDYLDAKEQASKQREKDAEWAKENPFLATLANFGNAPMQIFDYAGNLISGDTSELGRRRDVYDDKYVGRMSAYNEGVTTAIDDSIDNDVLSWLATSTYSGVTSAAQSAVTTLACSALFGPSAGPNVALAVLGSQAAASSYNQAIKNGSTYGEAFSYSIATGIAEAIMEKLPMDNLLDSIKSGSKGTVKEMLVSGLKNTAYQGLTEGSEELGTAVIDELADRFINGDTSGYNANIDRYMQFEGMTREEAEKKATGDFISEAVDSVVGGFIGGAASGGAVEVGKGIATGVGDIAQNKKTSYRLTEDDLQDYLDAGGRLNKTKKKVLDEGGKIILTSENEIVSYINEAISSPKKLNTVAYGKVNEELSRDVAEYSNGKINIEGSYLELVPYDINHAYRGHLKAKQEGDIDLTLEDFEKIPDYIDNYDDLVYAIKYKNGDSRVCLSKEIENGRVVIIEAVSKSRGSLQFKNMIGVSHEKYIEDYENRYKKRNSTNTRGDQGHNISPRDATVSTDSISETAGIVNEDSKKSLEEKEYSTAGNSTQEEEYSDPLAIENIGESDEYFEPLWEEENDVDTDLEDSETGTNSTQKIDNIETVSADRAAMETGEPTLIDAVEGDSGSLEAASKKYGAQAGAMTAVYREGQDIAKFDNAFRNAYNMGISGVPLSYAMNSSATSYLSEAQRENAWRIGTDAADLVARIKDEHYGKGKKNGIRKKGTVRGDGITLEELRAELNDTQNTALGLLRTYAEATGINIVLYKSEVNENGEFVGAQGKFSLSEDTIYIDINAGLHLVKTDKLNLSQYTMMRTFSHEFVHFCEKWNPVQYNEFRRLVFDRLTEQGVDVDELILIKQEQYGNVSYDAASREVMAEAMVDILPDSHFLEELYTKHKNIFTKLLERFKEFLSTLKAHFKSLTRNTEKSVSALREQVGDGISYFEDIVKTYDKMALEAVENYKATTIEKVSETVGETETAVTEGAVVEDAEAENNKAITAEKTPQTSETEEVDDTFIDPLEGEDLGENPFEPIIMNDGTKKADEVGGEVQYEIRENDGTSLDEYSYESYGEYFYKNKTIYSYDFLIHQDPMMRLDLPALSKIFKNGKIDNSTVVSEGKKNALLQEDSIQGPNGVVYVKNRYTKRYIEVNNGSIKHGLGGKKNYHMTNARIGMIVGDIIKNGIPINELTPSDGAEATYAMVAYAVSPENKPFLAIAHIDIVSGKLLELEAIGTVHSLRGRMKKGSTVVVNSTPELSFDNVSVNASTISISNLLTFVNSVQQSILSEDVLNHFKEARDPTGYYFENVLHQRRTDALSDREILYRAAEGLNALELSEGERSALEIFKKHLDELETLQMQREEQGRLYKEQMFTKGGDRAAAKKTLYRMQTLDAQIKRANEKLLSIEDKSVLQKVLAGARKVIEAEGRAKTKETLRRAKDRRDNGADIRKYRSRIERDSKTLSDWILNPNNKDITKHVPEVLREAVIPFLQSIDFTSKRQLRGGEATKADAEFAKRLRALDRAVRENVSPEGLYSGYIDLPPYFLGMLDACKSNIADIIGENNGSFVINQMTSEELKNLSEVVKALKKAIVEFNKFHANAMFQHVFEAGDSSVDFMQALNKNNEGVIASKISDFLKWKQMRPSYAFERFGEGGIAIYDGLRRGQAQLAFNTKEIIDFSEKAYTEKEVKDWEKEIHEFELGGDTVKIPVSFIMGLREIVKRGQGQGHVFGDGIRIATFTREGKKISDSGHLITEEEAATICSVLTDRQKDVADALQHFMADTGGKWGNEVSVARYGEKLFGEENYYPLSSDGRQLPATAEETPDSQGLYALLNMGFTKELTENASNRVIVYSIFDVFANHMASMAQYNALALPVLDTIKWFNYKQKTELEDGTVIEGTSVREEMARAYGSPEETTPGKGKPGYAESFITGIIRSFSGTEAQGVSTDSLGLKALKNYNVAQVAYNVRVVVQQPMAVTRAALLLDYRSIVRGSKLKPAVIKKNIEEMRKYSGIALWKDLGFYDVNISRGVTDLIKHDRSVMDKIIDVGMWGAGTADTLTWAAIWSATKEQIMKDRGIKPGDDGFFEAVTTLFEDVIYKTQVVDSVLTKNEFLRSKGLFARATGAFMSEPTTSASMLISSVEKIQLDMQRGFSFAEAWKKNKKIVGRTFVVYCVGQVLLAAAQAVVDAWRDDDEYENFGEKWLEAFFGNLVDELMPFNKLPIIGDIYDLAKEVLAQFTDLEIYGNPPSSIYMQWYDYVVKGVEILSDKLFGEDTNYTWYGAIYKLLQAVSGMTGLPLAATTRELVSAWNNIIGYMAPSLKLKSYDSGDKNEIKYAYQDGYLTEEEAIKLILESGEVEDENEAYFTIQSWGSEGDYSRFDLVFDAVYEGKDTDFAIEELCKHGYTEKEITSKVITQIGKWYYDDESDRRISKADAIKMLDRYTELSEKEITEKVNRWTCKVATGIAYEDIKEKYLSGELTKKRACEMYSVYGSMTKDEAREKVEKIKYIADFEKEYPHVEGVSYNRAKLYREYGESAGIDISVFLDTLEYKSSVSSEKDADGNVTLTAKDKVIDYIDELKLSDDKKDALYLACEYAESGLWKTPWN